jgi:ABC-2 type transport system permease protein
MAVASGALARRAFADARIRTITFAYLFALVAYVNASTYGSTYPTLADRLSFARSFGDNQAVRLLYGQPHDLLTVGGYSAWRAGGVLAVFAAVFGVLAAVRALRTEEDAGRAELVLSAPVGRTTAYCSALAGITATVALLWVAMLAGLAVAGLNVADSAYLALATVSAAIVFTGIGALASQLASTRGMAIELGMAAVAVFFVLRVVADTSSGAGWLRWATPLGWAEQLRPFAGAQPAVLLLPAAATVALLVAAGAIARRRDVGTGLVSSRDVSEPRRALLGSPLVLALRGEVGSLIGWIGGTAAFAFIVGVISASVSSAGLSENLQRQLEKLSGGASVLSPEGYVSFSFLFFVLAVSLFACSQMAAVRREEADQELETLFAQPVGRRRWLAERLGLGVAGATAVALTAGTFIWAGSATQGAGLSFADLVAAGANCLPATLLFLAIGALAFALVPRATAGIAYGLVSVAFLWQLFGALLDAPEWTLGLSPFHHVGLIPAESFKAREAAAMLGVAALAALAATGLFRRRDLAS